MDSSLSLGHCGGGLVAAAVSWGALSSMYWVEYSARVSSALVSVGGPLVLKFGHSAAEALHGFASAAAGGARKFSRELPKAAVCFRHYFIQCLQVFFKFLWQWYCFLCTHLVDWLAALRQRRST